MTAKHVIERLSKENNWFIVVHNDHENALLLNALIDCNYKIEGDDTNYVGIYKCYLEIHTVVYKDLKYMSDSCKNITGWFFNEVKK